MQGIKLKKIYAIKDKNIVYTETSFYLIYLHFFLIKIEILIP